jgi:toxin ParE1/3/4
VKRVRITGPARRDIANALRRSREDFGGRASERYRRLLDRALQDLATDPRRPGVRAIDDIRPGYFIYHLKSSAKAQPEAAVRRPRYLIAFRVDDSGDVIVARVFHERQMLARYLD